MKVCPDCGYKIDFGLAKFCHNCGNHLNEANTSTVEYIDTEKKIKLTSSDVVIHLDIIRILTLNVSTILHK